MEARMSNSVMIIPDALQTLQSLAASVEQSGVPPATLTLVYLRASQINDCSVCVDSGARHAKQAGETDERLFAVAALAALSAQDGKQVFTVREVYTEMRVGGTSYAERTIFKTMQRMKETPVRPP